MEKGLRAGRGLASCHQLYCNPARCPVRRGRTFAFRDGQNLLRAAVANTERGSFRREIKR